MTPSWSDRQLYATYWLAVGHLITHINLDVHSYPPPPPNPSEPPSQTPRFVKSFTHRPTFSLLLITAYHSYLLSDHNPQWEKNIVFEQKHTNLLFKFW